MNLSVVIPVNLLAKNSLGLSYIGDVLSGAGSYESILKPTVRAFNLTLGLDRGIGVKSTFDS